VPGAAIKNTCLTVYIVLLGFFLPDLRIIRDHSLCSQAVCLLLGIWESPTTMSNPKFPRPNAKMVFPLHSSVVLWKYLPLNFSRSARRRDGRSVQGFRSLELQYSAQLWVQPKIPGCWAPDVGGGDKAD